MLTIGTTNAYITGAATMTAELVRPEPSTAQALLPKPGTAQVPLKRQVPPKRLLLSAIAVTGAVLLLAYGLHLVSTAALVAAPTTLFLTVYLAAMTAALRVLRGAARLAAIPGAAAVLIMLTFCTWALAIPAAITLLTARKPRTEARRPTPSPAQRELAAAR